MSGSDSTRTRVIALLQVSVPYVDRIARWSRLTR